MKVDLGNVLDVDLYQPNLLSCCVSQGKLEVGQTKVETDGYQFFKEHFQIFLHSPDNVISMCYWLLCVLMVSHCTD